MLEEGVGAYGIVPVDFSLDPSWWNEAPEHWQRWRVHWKPIEAAEEVRPEAESVSLVLNHQPDGFAVVRRDTQQTTLYLREPLTAEGLVHPYLGSTVVAVAHWNGWHSFHAGSVVIKDRVWAMLGDRERGKTSALAWFSKSDYPVFADDVLVIRGGDALAGPRALDLRHPASRFFNMGHSIGVVGTRERWRHHLPPVPPELPFAGFVSLEWGPQVQVEEVSLPERLHRLGSAVAITAESHTGTSWLDLVASPMVMLKRPQRWDALDQAMAALLEALT